MRGKSSLQAAKLLLLAQAVSSSLFRGSTNISAQGNLCQQCGFRRWGGLVSNINDAGECDEFCVLFARFRSSLDCISCKDRNIEATQSPTAQYSTTKTPTMQTTRVPTYSHTRRPTERPISITTLVPSTVSPKTKELSSYPSELPPNTPTGIPTSSEPMTASARYPTTSPVEEPTDKPTFSPIITNPMSASTSSLTTSSTTNEPTLGPTFSHTLKPTQTKTFLQTIPPSNIPTPNPTDHRTIFPTSYSTSTPTEMNTKYLMPTPTETTTTKPTLGPTDVLTSYPTTTSLVSTKNPTLRQTPAQTHLPTEIPLNASKGLHSNRPTKYLSSQPNFDTPAVTTYILTDPEKTLWSITETSLSSTTSSPTQKSTSGPTLLPTRASTTIMVDPTYESTGSPTVLPTPAASDGTSNDPPQMNYTGTNCNVNLDNKTFTDDDVVMQFYAFGDTPYDSIATACLEKTIFPQVVLKNDVDFILHVGDFKRGRGVACTQAGFQESANLFAQVEDGGLDYFMIVGDNEWNDCNEPDDALNWWHDLFAMNNSQFAHFDAPTLPSTGQAPPAVDRQLGHEENFYFSYLNIAFIGINEAMSDRSKDDINVAWIQSKIDSKKHQAVVMFGHDNYSGKVRRVLKQEYSDIPILYVKGNSHSYCSEWVLSPPNVLRLTVDDHTAFPVLISIVYDGITGKHFFHMERHTGNGC